MQPRELEAIDQKKEKTMRKALEREVVDEQEAEDVCSNRKFIKPSLRALAGRVKKYRKLICSDLLPHPPAI